MGSPAPAVDLLLIERLAELEARVAALEHRQGVITDDELLGWPEWESLTRREREILSRLVHGDRVAAIADELYLSPRTVRSHLSAIFRKFGVHSQDQLLRLLRQASASAGAL